MGLRGPKPRRKEVVWSPCIAYAVGLMASDGCLSPDGRHLFFVSKDFDQIESVRKCFEICATPSHKPSGGKESKELYYRLQWGDIVLYDFLISVGLRPNKSRTIGAINVPNEYFFHFIRGVFDGDGCFYSYYDRRWKNSFMFYLEFSSASTNHVIWIQSKLFELAGVSGHITSSKRSVVYQLKYAKKETMRLLPLLYENSSELCLDRNRLKIQAALRIVGKSFEEI